MAADLTIDALIQVLARQDPSVQIAADSTTKVLENAFRRIQYLTQSAHLGFVGIAATLGYLGNVIVTQARHLETYKAMLTTVYGTASQAFEEVRAAFEYAKKTPFEVGEITRATVILAQYGANARVVLPLVASMAAGMQRPLMEVALATGKVWSGSLLGLRTF